MDDALATASARRGLVLRDRPLLLILAGVVLVPGVFGVSLTDRDEGWYAQVSREMVQRGDWIVPHYLGQPWVAKPPLLYWCIAGIFTLAGVNAWSARLVSVVAMTLVVQLVASLGRRCYGRRAAFFAGAAFITAALPAMVGKIVLTDALLLLWITAAAVLLWILWHAPPAWGRCALFWICIGLAILTKGPAVVLFIGSFAIALWLCRRSPAHLAQFESTVALRRPRRPEATAGDECGPAAGARALAARRVAALLVTLPLALLVAMPWYLAVAARAGRQFWAQFVGFEVMARLTGAPHGHGGPPGYYLILTLAAWLPWTPLVPGAVLEAWLARRAEATTRFVLLWLALPWLVLELIPSKLPHYILPCYVPLAVLFGRMWDAGLDQPHDRPNANAPHHRRGGDVPLQPRQAVVLRVWMIVVALAGAGPAWLAWYAWPAAPAWGLLGLMVVLLAGATGIGICVRRGRLGGAFGVTAGAAALFHLVLGLMVLPAVEPYRLSRQIARSANAMGGPGAEVLVAGYTEPTLFFYLERPARIVAAEEIARRREAGGGPFVFIVREDVADAAAIPSDPGPEAPQGGAVQGGPLGHQTREPLEHLRGFNYVKGRWEGVWVGCWREK